MNARLHRALLLGMALLASGLSMGLIRGLEWDPWLALCIGLLAPLALHAGLIGIDCLIAAGAASDPVDGGLATGRRRAWLGVWLRETRDAAWAFGVTQPFLAQRPLASAPPNADHLPMLLLHGYFCNRALWQTMARRLADAGHCVAAIDLEPTWCSIDDYASQIARAVEALRRETGAKQVALLGHSMGGLAARAYLRACGDADVAQVITLGTPHRGTVHARFGLGQNAQQMRRDSPWLQTLAASEPPARLARFTVILSLHDNIVAPQALQTLPGARLHRLPGIGHVSLVYDRGVADRVLACLDQK